LRSLQTKEPALKFSPAVNDELNIDASEMTGVRHKILDDLADGIFCAYLAYYFWYWGEERCWLVGYTDNGYVALPRCGLPTCGLNGCPGNSSM
jgi:predicted RNase H-like nuclease